MCFQTCGRAKNLGCLVLKGLEDCTGETPREGAANELPPPFCLSAQALLGHRQEPRVLVIRGGAALQL